MLFSPFLLSAVCFVVGLLYVAHGMGKLDLVQAVANRVIIATVSVCSARNFGLSFRLYLKLPSVSHLLIVICRLYRSVCRG